MNRICINGRLIKDPDLKTFENNTTLCTFFIANDIWYGNNKKTGFYKCHAWGVPGKIIAENAKTGSELYLSGRLEQYRYEDENKKTVYDNSIVVEQFDFGARASGAADEPGQQEVKSA